MNLDLLMTSITDSTTASSMTLAQFLICTAFSIGLGLAIGLIYMFRHAHSKEFVATLAVLPAIVQTVIMLVNGNMGVGVAVLGAFSLVRFRSLPGSARDIASIFLAMAVGLACGMGYVGLACVFVVVMAIASVALTCTNWGAEKKGERQLKVSIPESLDYQEVFDDIFERYLQSHDLDAVRTTNMGSLYQLCYRVSLRPGADEKAFLDELRCRNGNLEVALGRNLYGREVL